MSRSESAAELSMEDILASIRSLVPADQRGEGGESTPPAAPPVPPTLNRVGDRPLVPPPPTLPLGALAPQRAAQPFEDDLADLLDDPDEASLPPVPVANAAATFERPQLDGGSERPFPDLSGASADMAALFVRPPVQQADAPASPLAQVPPVETSEPLTVAAEPVRLETPAPAPVPPLMGLGQNGGFFPPPFGKRSIAPAVAASETKAGADVEPSLPPASVPPLKRSFFPASYQALSLPIGKDEPAHEAPPAAVQAAGEPLAPTEASFPQAAAPVQPSDSVGQQSSLGPSVSSTASHDDDRPSYSDALDQALKRLQGLGSLVPEAASAPMADFAKPDAPKFDVRSEAVDSGALDPRLFGAVPPRFAVPAEEATATPPLSSAAQEVEAQPAPPMASGSADVPAAPEAQSTTLEPARPGAAPTPTVRLSDALWSKSAPSTSTDVTPHPLSPQGAIPETVDFLDVPPASPMVKAFGALALGLASSGSQGTAVAPAAAARTQAPDAPLAVASVDPEPQAVPAAVFDPEPVMQADRVAEPNALVAAAAPLQAAQARAAASSEPQGLQRSLEDVVADMLRPLLKQWIEDNMPRIMEKALRAETRDKRD